MKPATVVGYSAYGIASFWLASYNLKSYMEAPLKMGVYPDIVLDDVKLSIQLSTLNEEEWVEMTCESIIKQPLYQKYHPERIEFVLIDSHSEDRTIEIASQYVDNVIESPRGLFTARNIGAKSTDADIIVTIDAAQIYPLGWLNLLLRHFSDENIIAVTGAKLVPKTANIFHAISNLWGNQILNHMWGDNSAIRRDAWLISGGWREDINQQSFKETFQEEFDIFKRLKGIGKVVKDIQAVTYDLRTRFGCNGGGEEITQYCEMIRVGERF